MSMVNTDILNAMKEGGGFRSPISGQANNLDEISTALKTATANVVRIPAEYQARATALIARASPSVTKATGAVSELVKHCDTQVSQITNVMTAVNSYSSMYGLDSCGSVNSVLGLVGGGASLLIQSTQRAFNYVNNLPTALAEIANLPVGLIPAKLTDLENAQSTALASLDTITDDIRNAITNEVSSYMGVCSEISRGVLSNLLPSWLEVDCVASVFTSMNGGLTDKIKNISI